jgi:hypothetical protein
MAQPNFDSVFNRFFRDEIARRWRQLTTSDLDECSADRSKLPFLLETRYGYARRRAEKEADIFIGEFHDRLRLAA